jgi:hypothetical protein
VMNIDQFDSTGNRVCRRCFAPEGGLALGDCMLAQKIALEPKFVAARCRPLGDTCDWKPSVLTENKGSTR